MRNFVLALSILLVAPPLLTACSGDREPPAEDAATLGSQAVSRDMPSESPSEDFGHRIWRFETVQGQTVPVGVEVTLELDYESARASGVAACNRFTGQFKQDGETFQVDMLASTKRACPDPLMTLEDRFLQALRTARTLSLDSGLLVMTDASGQRSTARGAPLAEPD